MASIHEVAQAAGVSISTVSYALSGKRPVSEKTRKRINAVVEELGYLPNAGARMLAGRRTGILALTAPMRPDTYAPAHMAFVLAVSAAARRYDYDILLLTADEASGGLSRVGSSSLVDGVVLLDVDEDDERVALVQKLSLPSVAIGLPADSSNLNCVDLDFEAATDLAISRLQEQGHESIALIGQASSVYERGSNFPERVRRRFAQTTTERGLSGTFVMPSDNAPALRAELAELLADGATALILQCESGVQQSVLEVLRSGGYRIPSDISIISLGTTTDTSVLEPPLDVIPLIPQASCDRAIERLVARLEGESPTRSVELLAPEYRPFGSTAPAPGFNRTGATVASDAAFAAAAPGVQSTHAGGHAPPHGVPPGG
ncbi:MAG: LacI family DNA-binding transcriptional regulator [Mycetocola sp.]